jgi:hypothetical protein
VSLKDNTGHIAAGEVGQDAAGPPPVGSLYGTVAPGCLGARRLRARGRATYGAPATHTGRGVLGEGTEVALGRIVILLLFAIAACAVFVANTLATAGPSEQAKAFVRSARRAGSGGYLPSVRGFAQRSPTANTPRGEFKEVGMAVRRQVGPVGVAEEVIGDLVAWGLLLLGVVFGLGTLGAIELLTRLSR